MVSLFEALKIIDEEIIELSQIKKVSLENALGKISAIDVVSKLDSPAMKTSAMDGYAFRYEDIKETIKVVGFAQAGESQSLHISKNEAYKIFTGAILPQGADTIVVVEDACEENGYLNINHIPKIGANIRVPGDNFKKGDILLPKGSKIGSVEIALLASLGECLVSVYDSPKVAVISFGEELIELGEDLKNGKIFSSNNYAICALLKEYGIESSNIGIIRDDYEFSKKTIEEALSINDYVVTTGGMSKGDFDYIKNILKELSAKALFEGVKIKPGKPVSVYGVGKKYIIGLPGYPNSAYMTFSIFGLPLVLKKIGISHKFPTMKALLKNDITKKGDRLEFTPVSVNLEDGKIVANNKEKRDNSSSIINNMVGNSAMLMLSENRVYKSGEEVDLYFYKSVFGV